MKSAIKEKDEAGQKKELLIEEKSREIKRLKEQMEKEVVDKNDYEKLCIEFQTKNNSVTNINKDMEDELNKKDD